MAAVKFLLLFAAISVASVSADLAQDLWNDAIGKFQNATRKMESELNAATGSDTKLVDVMTTQVNAFTANFTEMLNSVKANVADKFGTDFSEKVNVSIDSMINTVIQKLDPGTTLTAEKVKQNTVQGLETLSSQFRNLTSNLEVPLTKITQTFAQSIQKASSALEDISEKIRTNVQST